MQVVEIHIAVEHPEPRGERVRLVEVGGLGGAQEVHFAITLDVGRGVGVAFSQQGHAGLLGREAAFRDVVQVGVAERDLGEGGGDGGVRRLGAVLRLRRDEAAEGELDALVVDLVRLGLGRGHGGLGDVGWHGVDGLRLGDHRVGEGVLRLLQLGGGLGRLGLIGGHVVQLGLQGRDLGAQGVHVGGGDRGRNGLLRRVLRSGGFRPGAGAERHDRAERNARPDLRLGVHDRRFLLFPRLMRAHLKARYRRPVTLFDRICDSFAAAVGSPVDVTNSPLSGPAFWGRDAPDRV